jgi:hypothetical protein
MSNSRREPGLDGRHRDADGRIEQKHGNTRVDTLRDTYGNRIPPAARGDMKLSTLLDRTNSRSLSELLKK